MIYRPVKVKANYFYGEGELVLWSKVGQGQKKGGPSTMLRAAFLLTPFLESVKQSGCNVPWVLVVDVRAWVQRSDSI